MSLPPPLDGTADPVDPSGPPDVLDLDDPCPHCGAAVADSWLVCAWCGEPLAAPAELPPGTMLRDGRFVIGSVLGRGGFGITYAVDDQRLQRRVAVKELFPDAAVRHREMVLTPPEGRLAFRDARTRFLGEARVLARFNNPGIVRVSEVFEEHNTAYLVMELLEGRTLSELLRARGGPLSVGEALDVAVRVGGALRAVHAAGVLHRDLNPANIVLTDVGRIVLIDFGIARSFDQGTRSLTRMVTPGYAPPEQYHGSGPFGPPTDVYGLAATLYRLLTDRIPTAALERQGGVHLLSPHALVGSVPKSVSDAVLDGLELDAGHRPASIDAFLARLGLPMEAEGPRSGLIDRFPLPTVAPAPPPPPQVQQSPVPQPPAQQPPAPMPAPVPAPSPAWGPLPVSMPVSSPVPPPYVPPVPVESGPAVPGRAVGPHRAGFAMAMLLPVLALMALCSAAPVAIVAIVVVLFLPAAATWGDVILLQYEYHYGEPARWVGRQPAPVVALVRMGPNIVVSLVRAVPAIALDVVLVGAWALLRNAGAALAWQEAMLRLAGAATALVLWLPVRHGSPRFRVDIALERAADEMLTERGRLNITGWTVWIVALSLIAIALAFHPDPWPIHS